MKKLSVLLMLVVLTICVLASVPCRAQNSGSTINLPTPALDNKVTVEQAIMARRSVRSFADEPITLQQVSNLLWAAQGITDPATGHRAAPSAMAAYPLEVYLVAAKVTGLPAGIYHYIPKGHQLVLLSSGDHRVDVSAQASVKQAPASLAITCNVSKISNRFGEKQKIFAALEAGHAAENVCLETVSLGLATVTVGGVNDEQMTKALNLSKDESPLYILPIGKKK